MNKSEVNGKRRGYDRQNKLKRIKELALKPAL